MPHVETPVRSLEQRRAALEKANAVRSFRKTLKRDLEGGRTTFCQVVRFVPKQAETMAVFDLMLHIPKVGRVKADRMLAVVRISPSKTLGGLSQRQRAELVREMRGR